MVEQRHAQLERFPDVFLFHDIFKQDFVSLSVQIVRDGIKYTDPFSRRNRFASVSIRCHSLHNVQILLPVEGVIVSTDLLSDNEIVTCGQRHGCVEMFCNYVTGIHPFRLLEMAAYIKRFGAR